MEGVEAVYPEACLLHSPLKWVDEDEAFSLSEHNQNYSLIASEINNHLINEDRVNDNFVQAETATNMVNGRVNVPAMSDSENNVNCEKQTSSKCECEYHLLSVDRLIAVPR